MLVAICSRPGLLILPALCPDRNDEVARRSSKVNEKQHNTAAGNRADEV